RHGANCVTAHALDPEVKSLLLRGRKESRQRINFEVRQLLGTRIGHYLLLERKQTNKWAPAKFRLIKTDAKDAGALIREAETPEEPERAAAAAPETAAAESEEAAYPNDEADADNWQFNKEPAPQGVPPPTTSPDPFNPDFTVRVWKNAF